MPMTSEAPVTATATSCQSPTRHEGQPREDESDEKGGAQSLRSGQRQGADGADECPDADRRVQIADAAVAEVEEVECDDHDEDLRRPKSVVWAVSRITMTRSDAFCRGW